MVKLLDEARRFGKSLIGWLYIFVPLFIFFFAFGLKPLEFFGRTLLLPYPTTQSFAAIVVARMQDNLLKDGARLIVTSPMDAFSALAQTAFLLAFVASLPILLYKLLSFFSPALYANERYTILLVLLPSIVLFALGAVFAYLMLIPKALGLLYEYAGALGAESFITTNKFIGFVLGMILFTGILFLTPVFMALLSRTGLVPGYFWKKNWNWALVFFLILSGIVTPDGTGVTMAMLSVPLVLLYFVGYMAANG